MSASVVVACVALLTEAAAVPDLIISVCCCAKLDFLIHSESLSGTTEEDIFTEDGTAQVDKVEAPDTSKVKGREAFETTSDVVSADVEGGHDTLVMLNLFI